MSQAESARLLAIAIRRARHAQDGRGRTQAARLCALALGGSSIDRAAADAAVRLGQWLRELAV